MNMSESIANLAKSLSIVQGQLTFAPKDSKNPFFKSNYADLGSVWESCRKLLAENGLSVMQFPGEYIDGCMQLTTILTHESGEYIEHEMSVPVTKPDAQGAGSAITYMRRYALAAVIGIYQADDDGHSASETPAAKLNPPTAKITVNTLTEIQGLLEETKTDVAKVLEHYKKTALPFLSVSEGNQLIEKLKEKLNVSQ